MSYSVVYAFASKDDFHEGSEIASASGWLAFANWAAELSDKKYPKLVRLANRGECGPYAPDIVALEQELTDVLRLKRSTASADVLGVGQALLKELRSRPTDADCLVCTDGVSSGGEFEE